MIHKKSGPLEYTTTTTMVQGSALEARYMLRQVERPRLGCKQGVTVEMSGSPRHSSGSDDSDGGVRISGNSPSHNSCSSEMQRDQDRDASQRRQVTSKQTET